MHLAAEGALERLDEDRLVAERGRVGRVRRHVRVHVVRERQLRVVREREQPDLRRHIAGR